MRRQSPSIHSASVSSFGLSEAISKAGLTLEKQRSASTEIKARYGDYQSMEFHEAVTTSKLPGLTIFRFRGTFSKGQTEVRVVVSKAEKVAGLFVLPWTDVIQ